MEGNLSLDIREIYEIIIKRLWILVLITTASVIVSGIFSLWIIHPVYEARTTILVGKYLEGEDDRVNYDDLLVYQNVVKTYIEIAKSSLVAEKAIQKLGKDITIEDFLKNISVSSHEDTQIIVIETRSKSAEDAANTVNYLAESFIEECQKLLPTGSVKVLDNARLLNKPVFPKPVNIIIISAFIGIMLSLVIILLISYFDNTIKSEKELKKYTGVPVLGIIPKDNWAKKLKSIKLNISTLEDPKSFISESYKTLRTNIQFSLGIEGPKIIMVTSAIPDEGKTTTSVNLGVTMAQTGKKTLIMDCDLRSPKVHRVFKLTNILGLSDLLVGIACFEEVVQKTDMNELYVLSAGTRPPNPSELLSSEKMKKIVDDTKLKFDFIILDTPPIVMFTDGQVVSQCSMGSILVVSAEESERKSTVKAIELLEKANSRILGTVLNKYAISQNEYYGKNYSNYHEGRKKNRNSKKREIKAEDTVNN